MAATGRIDRELTRVRSQLAALQKKAKELEEEKQMAEDAEKLKFMEKNKITMEQLMLLNRVSEAEIRRLLEQKKEEEISEGRI